MTTDEDLTEQIARALRQATDDGADRTEDYAAAVLPIIARLEAQTDIRGRAVVIYRDRAREAEARIEAVQDLIDQADTAGDWTITCSRLQWAIDGTTPNPYRASETA